MILVFAPTLIFAIFFIVAKILMIDSIKKICSLIHGKVLSRLEPYFVSKDPKLTKKTFFEPHTKILFFQGYSNS
ncbi:uncharacterized protein TOL2_C03610 [Desulfobacula toluolica Tol2]|uniref:Uncharacterized protein n=1 Tax=Desulfobacula toluolica (strain DSM 7467 / Tol2) TaxID=651182 RepID=K0NCI5_DESTT|nr:uncharacterized protein TOL2_C03610 [Desulfobacula toluolica Tol2]